MPETAARFQVIVPCYNPPADWEQALANRFSELQLALSGLVESLELILVNDGSTQGFETENITRLKALAPQLQVLSYVDNRGKGYALRQGVEAANADFMLVTDIDFPYTIESMRRLVATLREKGGIAAGNRNTAYYTSVPAFRRLLSRGLRWLLRYVLRQPIDDSQCGLKGFDQAGKAVFLETSINRFLFDLEFLMLANGRVRVTPVPVALRPGIVFTSVSWKILAVESGNFIKLFFQRFFK